MIKVWGHCDRPAGETCLPSHSSTSKDKNLTFLFGFSLKMKVNNIYSIELFGGLFIFPVKHPTVPWLKWALANDILITFSHFLLSKCWSLLATLSWWYHPNSESLLSREIITPFSVLSPWWSLSSLKTLFHKPLSSAFDCLSVMQMILDQ